MAYSNSPQYSTYKTERVSLVKDVFLRSTNQYDALYENCVIETLKNKDTKQFDIAAVKRPGTTTILSASNIASEFRGMFFWGKHNSLIYVIGNTFYHWDVSTDISTATAIGTTLTTTTGEVGFEEFLYSSGNVTVVWSDGVQLGEITSTFTVNVCADPDLPSPHLPNPVYLDGYIFVVKKDTQDIYNSDNDNPLSWSVEYISAEMSPDSLLRIERMSNYIVALGTESIEYFYDAANAAGSPLGRNDTFYKQIRYLGGSVRSGNKIFMIGKYDNGSPDIFIIEDSKVTPVDNQQVKRFLSRVTDFTTATASIVSWDSNTLYVFTVGDSTFAYNVSNDMFTNWKHRATNKFDIKYSEIINTTNQNINTFMYMSSFNSIIKFDLNTWQDSGVAMTYKIRTEPLDFDTLQMKFMGRLSLYTDNSNTTANISVQWTDDDYRTYSNVYPIALQQELPSIRRLGGFRKRAFVFTNNENQPIRFKGFEVDLNMGNS